MGVEYSSSLYIRMPELNVVLGHIFLESLEVPVIANMLISGIGESHKELANPTDSGDVSLPSVGDFTVVSADRADGVRKLGVTFKVRKVMLQGGFGDCLVEPKKKSMGGVSAKMDCS